MRYRNNSNPWYRQPVQGQRYGSPWEPQRQVPVQEPSRMRPQVEVPPKVEPQAPVVEPPVRPVEPQTMTPPAENEWQEKALRLQAEMDNFRKRQTRRADEAIAAERERLLNHFLPILDNLERALNQPQGSDEALRQGVE